MTNLSTDPWGFGPAVSHFLWSPLELYLDPVAVMWCCVLMCWCDPKHARSDGFATRGSRIGLINSDLMSGARIAHNIRGELMKWMDMSIFMCCQGTDEECLVLLVIFDIDDFAAFPFRTRWSGGTHGERSMAAVISVSFLWFTTNYRRRNLKEN